MPTKIIIRFTTIIIIMGLLEVICGLFLQLDDNRKRDNYESTNAYIFKTVNKSGERQVLYIRYNVNKITYEKVVINNKEKNNTSHIKIYYDKLNPEKFTIEEKSNKGLYLIISGLVLIVFSFILNFIKK